MEVTNDYAFFVTYILYILVASYRDFESRIELLTTKGLSKPDRVREVIKNHLEKITKSEIMAKCPDISQATAPARTGGAVEKQENHQTQRRALYGVCLEWGRVVTIFTKALSYVYSQGSEG